MVCGWTAGLSEKRRGLGAAPRLGGTYSCSPQIQELIRLSLAGLLVRRE